MPPYLFVVNPYTGKHVNVLPMFAVLQDRDEADEGSLDNFIIPLQLMQDFLAVDVRLDDTNNETLASLNNANYTIIKLRRMFQAMAEPI